MAPAPARSPDILTASGGRKILSGFFLSGLLMSFVGAILPAWGHHLRSEFIIAGNYFLVLNLGMLISIRIALVLVPRKGIPFTMVLGSSLAAAGFLALSAVPSAAAPSWHYLGLAVLGIAAGLLNSAVFFGLTSVYQQDKVSTVNVAGMLFGLGCLLTSVLVAGTFYAYSVHVILILFAIIPALFLHRYATAKLPPPDALRHRPLREVLSDFRSPGAVMFALLLFFQFGNEWTVAGWLPVFLIQRVGVSPAASLVLLSVYWLSLLVGRVAAQALLVRVKHARLLMASILAALFGCFILSLTDNLFGATTAVLLIGFGFAAIYPLVVEKIAHRFPYYHPAFYNGIFAFAATGGLLAPATLGYYADSLGIGVVTGIPLAGICMVVVLLLFIWLESKLTAPAAPSSVSR